MVHSNGFHDTICSYNRKGTELGMKINRVNLTRFSGGRSLSPEIMEVPSSN
jgi:hypothetical protein